MGGKNFAFITPREKCFVILRSLGYVRRPVQLAYCRLGGGRGAGGRSDARFVGSWGSVGPPEMCCCLARRFCVPEPQQAVVPYRVVGGIGRRGVGLFESSLENMHIRKGGVGWHLLVRPMVGEKPLCVLV